MVSVTQVAKALRSCLVDLPPTIERSCGDCQRRSKFTGAAFVQTTVLGWLARPTASLHELTVMAAEVGVSITPQGIDQRFGEAGADLLQQVFEAAVGQMVAADPVAMPVLARFPAVILLDSTTITLPDELAELWVSCGGRTETTPRSAVKATVRWDLCGGRLEGPVLTAGRSQDKASPLQHAPVPAGGLRIGDLGFWSLAVLEQIRAQEAHFLSRLHVQTVLFRASDAERLDLDQWLAEQTVDQIDLAVTMGVSARLPARLLAIRVPPTVAAERRRTMLADAQREGERPSQRKLKRADWTLLVTSVAPAALSVAEAAVLIRARWQLEQLFKLWKSQGQIDDWRSHDPQRILCELYAKLTAMIIQHWLLLTGGWARADRSLTRSALTIRHHTPVLALTLGHHRALVQTLRLLAHTLATGTRITKRRSHPATVQLLQNPALTGLA